MFCHNTCMKIATITIVIMCAYAASHAQQISTLKWLFIKNNVAEDRCRTNSGALKDYRARPARQMNFVQKA